MLWHGAIVDVPSGWAYCDGTLGTPDLRGRFIRSVSAIHPPGLRGGADTHTHDFTGDSHRHSIGAGSQIAAGADIAQQTGFAPATGTTDAEEHLPKYHCLCYIMKL